MQRRFRTREEAEAHADELVAERAAQEAQERLQRDIVRANMRRGDVVVDLLRLAPEDKVAVAVALDALRAAGGSAADLPAAAREYVDAHLTGSLATVEEVVQKHLADLAALGRSAETIRQRRRYCDLLAERVGRTRRATTLSRAEIAEWIADASPTTRVGRYVAAAALLRWAWQRGYTREYALAGLPKPQTPRKGEVAILRPEQVRKLMAVAWREEPQTVNYFALGVFAGLRPQSELVWVRWEDVDFEDGKIFVVSRKTHQARPVPISDNLRRWLELTPQERRVGLVAPLHRRALWRVMRRAGVAVGHDVLRHTRCSYRLAEVRDPGIVAAEGGHTPAILRRHYANLRIKAADVAEFWGIVPEGETIAQ